MQLSGRMEIESNQRPEQAHDLASLVACGDGACAQGDAEGLAEIAHLLAICVAPPAQVELMAIEGLAHTDLQAAGERWWRVTRRVRELLAFTELPFHRD
jgi:hypothetical protein